MKSKISKLATMMSMPAMDGTMILFAIAGLLTFANALFIGLFVISGPVAMTTAALFKDNLFNNIFSATAAGLIATISVVIAAVLGPQLNSFVNIDMLKIFGGLATITIGLTFLGIKIPDKIPLIIVGFGLLISIMGGIAK